MTLLAFPGSPKAWLGAVVVLVASFALMLIMTLMKQLKRCPTNRVLVIYGRGGNGRDAVTCIHGGTKFVVPLLQDYAWLSLDPIRIEIPLRDALTSGETSPISPSVFTVAIGATSELMQNAANRLVGLSPFQIADQAEDIIISRLRPLLASMPIEDIVHRYDTFLNAVQSSLEPSLAELGLVLINVNIFGRDLRIRGCDVNEDDGRQHCHADDHCRISQ